MRPVAIECPPARARHAREGPMSDQQVLSETAQGIATITLNRPAALNALTPQMMEGLIDATARAERDDDIRCVLIRGAGDHFMAGGDVKGFHQSPAVDRGKS